MSCKRVECQGTERDLREMIDTLRDELNDVRRQHEARIVERDAENATLRADLARVTAERSVEASVIDDITRTVAASRPALIADANASYSPDYVASCVEVLCQLLTTAERELAALKAEYTALQDAANGRTNGARNRIDVLERELAAARARVGELERVIDENGCRFCKAIPCGCK